MVEIIALICLTLILSFASNIDMGALSSLTSIRKRSWGKFGPLANKKRP